MTATGETAVVRFIERWQASSAAERANYQLFLSELCDVLGVARPEPTGADEAKNAYVFERAVTFQHGDGTTSTGRIDLYKKGFFVLEAKQGSEGAGAREGELFGGAKKGRRGTAIRGTAGWDDAMLAARGQAEQYVRALPDDNPPFVLVVDVGHSIELYSETPADLQKASHCYAVRQLTTLNVWWPYSNASSIVWNGPDNFGPPGESWPPVDTIHWPAAAFIPSSRGRSDSRTWVAMQTGSVSPRTAFAGSVICSVCPKNCSIFVSPNPAISSSGKCFFWGVNGPRCFFLFRLDMAGRIASSPSSATATSNRWRPPSLDLLPRHLRT